MCPECPLYLGLCFPCSHVTTRLVQLLVQETGIRGTQITCKMTPPDEKAETLSPGPSRGPAPSLSPVSIPATKPPRAAPFTASLFTSLGWQPGEGSTSRDSYTKSSTQSREHLTSVPTMTNVSRSSPVWGSAKSGSAAFQAH